MAENAQKKNKLVIVLIIVLVVVLAAAGIIIWQLLGERDDEPGLNYTSENGIGYDINAQLITSGDVAFSQPEGVAVRFKPVAASTDGINFECEIGNSLANTLDMYIGLYTDVQAEDQIYLSGLMRPGEGITFFKAEHEMPKGTYDVILVLTLVEDDHKTLHSQSKVALTLVVD